jgi:predicted nucleic acid-binding protein
MPVVSNTSPILNLAIIGRLDLLRQQFSEVLIPPMVLQELKVDTELPGVEPIRLALQNRWLQVVELSNTDIARALRRDLDNGEAEAIALALQLKLMTVLIDEHDGRAAAKAMGLVPVGVLGILLRAKRTGNLDSVVTAMRALQDQADFFINPDLFASLAREASER